MPLRGGVHLYLLVLLLPSQTPSESLDHHGHRASSRPLLAVSHTSSYSAHDNNSILVPSINRAAVTLP